MDEFLNKFYFLKSRKFWAFIGGIITILSAAFQAEVFPTQEVITGIVALVLGYMGTTAWEDTARSQAESKAATTTVSTPGTSDVQVTKSDTSAPAHPMIGRMGG